MRWPIKICKYCRWLPVRIIILRKILAGVRITLVLWEITLEEWLNYLTILFIKYKRSRYNRFTAKTDI